MRNKHILINLTDDQYKQIEFIASKERRKVADVAYLLIVDSLSGAILPYITVNTEIKRFG